MFVPFLSLHFGPLHGDVYEHKLCSVSLQPRVPPQFIIYYPYKYSLLEINLFIFLYIIRDTKQGRDRKAFMQNGAF